MNTRARTLLAIDVDGVLNGLDGPQPDDHRVAVQVENDHGVFTVRFDPRVIDRVNALTQAGLVDLTWVTTWGRAARDTLAPAIGLDAGSAVLEDPNDTRLARHPYDPARPWWKLDLVLGSLRDDPDRPVAWAEDDLDDATRRRFPDLHPGPSLLIAPDPGIGLTLQDVDRVEAFARRHVAD